MGVTLVVECWSALSEASSVGMPTIGCRWCQAWRCMNNLLPAQIAQPLALPVCIPNVAQHKEEESSGGE